MAGLAARMFASDDAVDSADDAASDQSRKSLADMRWGASAYAEAAIGADSSEACATEKAGPWNALTACYFFVVTQDLLDDILPTVMSELRHFEDIFSCTMLVSQQSALHI